jgi:hypothetical protein
MVVAPLEVWQHVLKGSCNNMNRKIEMEDVVNKGLKIL